MLTLLTKRLVFQVAIAIAVPVLTLGIPARIVDKKLGTSPWILLGGILVALHITLVILIFRFKKLFANSLTE